LAGSNSFTEAQATARIVELGYTNVSGLAKDSAGVWRGTATKDGKTTNFALDFKGNIVVGQK
jgi:putative membrane protein